MAAQPLEELDEKHFHLKEQKFDLLISHTIGSFPAMLAYRLNISKAAYYLTAGTFIMEHTAANLRLPMNPSHIVSTFVKWSSTMSFVQRMKNCFYKFMGSRFAAKYVDYITDAEEKIWRAVGPL